MSCRHNLATGTCTRCYPDNPHQRSAHDRVDPGPEEEYGPNLDGVGAVSREPIRCSPVMTMVRGVPAILSGCACGNWTPPTSRDSETDVESDWVTHAYASLNQPALTRRPETPPPDKRTLVLAARILIQMLRHADEETLESARLVIASSANDSAYACDLEPLQAICAAFDAESKRRAFESDRLDAVVAKLGDEDIVADEEA